MPTRAVRASLPAFRVGFTLNASIGQGATTVNPLQLALSYAAIANGGTLYEPQLVRAVETADGTVVQDFAPRVRRRIDARPEDLAFVRRALWASSTTTKAQRTPSASLASTWPARPARPRCPHRSVRVGDDSRVWYFNRDHAWFAAYAPANAPEIALIVLIEHGGAGGRHAAPVVFTRHEGIRTTQSGAHRQSKRSRRPARRFAQRAP